MRGAHSVRTSSRRRWNEPPIGWRWTWRSRSKSCATPRPSCSVWSSPCQILAVGSPRIAGSFTPLRRTSARPSCLPAPSVASSLAIWVAAALVSTCSVRPPSLVASQIGRARGDLQYRLSEASRELAHSMERRYADATGRMQAALQAAEELRDAAAADDAAEENEIFPNGRRPLGMPRPRSTRRTAERAAGAVASVHAVAQAGLGGGDLEQPVVLGGPFAAAARRTSGDRSRCHREVGDEAVLGLT